MSDSVERLRLAADRVVRHCFKQPGDSGLMSIPADRERDVDLLLTEAADEIESLRSRLALWEQVWTALNDMGAELGDANKPLAVTASWALLRTRAENAERALVENEARLAEAADEIERLRVKADTLQFLVNQRDIDIEGYKARLAEAEALSPAGSRA